MDRGVTLENPSQQGKRLLFVVDALTECHLHHVHVQYSFSLLATPVFKKQTLLTSTDAVQRRENRAPLIQSSSFVAIGVLRYSEFSPLRHA